MLRMKNIDSGSYSDPLGPKDEVGSAYIKAHSSVSSPSRSQAVVSVSTPRMYSLSGYYLVVLN